MDDLKLLVVVARYSENISWVNLVNKPFVIYNKGIDIEGYPSIKLNNVGRETDTFLRFILNNYHNLPDNVCFLQGNPFDHFKDVINFINNFSIKNDNIIFLSQIILKESCNWGLLGNPPDKFVMINTDTDKSYTGYNLSQVANFLKLNHKLIYEFAPGGQYIVPKSMILNKSLDWWINAFKVHESFYHAPWFYERLWPSIFTHEEIS
jgi:hypothetical protein